MRPPLHAIHRTQTHRTALLTAAVLLMSDGGVWGIPSAVFAQPPVAVEGSHASGRDFNGLLLSMPEQQGGLTIVTRAGWTWVEDAQLAPSVSGEKKTLGAAVQRMFLKGDVRFQIGSRRLTAARAVVWVERIDDGTGPEDQAVHQVAIYFDRVGNPVGAVGAGATGDRLLMTARVRGPFTLACDAPPRDGRPSPAQCSDLVAEGEARLARYIDGLEDPSNAPTQPASTSLPRPDPNTSASAFLPSLNRPYEPGSPYGVNGPRAPITRLRNAPGLDAFGGVGAGGDQRLFSAARGVFTIAAGQPVIKTEENENKIIITGGVVIQYSEPARDRSLQLSAQNAVVFLAPGKLDDISKAPADKVLGIYLEGDVVATDNRFTLRAPHIYYDLAANQAYTVDAVFWTYDERRGLPLYVRADTIRQTTRNSITATGVTIAASSFYDPILTMGAQSVTISRESDPTSPTGGSRVMLDGKSFTPRIGGMPFFWLPSYNGDIERFPLKDIRFENSSDSGFGMQTRWDYFGLTGYKPPEDLDMDVDILIDAWFKRGIALGTDVRWRNPDNNGSFLGYWVPHDDGTDVLSSGERVDRNGDARGLALYEQRINLDGGWVLLAEGSTVSDPNFIDSYFEQMAETRREFTSGLTLRHPSENSLYTYQIKGNFDDFVANEYLLQSQGYTVKKVPEMTYTRVADDLMSEKDPGTLLWTHEYRFGRMGLQFFKPTASEFGYPNATESQEAFGLNPNQSFYDFYTGEGYSQDEVFRVHTRQQLEWNLNYGPVKVQPFAIGRATYYSDSFKDIAPQDQQDQLRWWAGGGVRASTQMQRIYEGVESSTLDIHQIRHIIEPNATFFTAGTNRRSEYLPIYDYTVEGAQQGTAWRLGVDQTFQTMRGRTTDPSASGTNLAGGRTVDLLKWNVDYVNGTSDTDKNGPLGKWFDYRPEESIFGNYVNTDSQLLLTDATSLIAGTTYDLDENQASRTSFGVATDHGRDFKTFAELRYINPLDSTFVSFGGDYRLTALYTIGFNAAYDTNDGEIQDIAVRVNREFADMTLSIRVRYNNITGETTAGVIFTPLGRNRRLDNMRRIGRDQYLEPLTGPVGQTDAAP